MEDCWARAGVPPVCAGIAIKDAAMKNKAANIALNFILKSLTRPLLSRHANAAIGVA